MQGIVQHVAKDSLPIINFNGKLVTLTRASFDVFDLKQHKNLASRKQFPIILAFALTVHRAQGQSLQNVEIDCYSFFAPGQMGVAVGRAVSIGGLRILNYIAWPKFMEIHKDKGNPQNNCKSGYIYIRKEILIAFYIKNSLQCNINHL